MLGQGILVLLCTERAWDASCSRGFFCLHGQIRLSNLAAISAQSEQARKREIERDTHTHRGKANTLEELLRPSNMYRLA